MVALEDALRILTEKVEPRRLIRLPLEKCFGRILAEDIVSDMDFPPFDRSPLDGYAVRGADIRTASPERPVYLQQIDYVPAGACPTKRVGAGQAIRIMTGAKMPDGAEAVVRIEDTSLVNDRVTVLHVNQADKNICRRGEEFRSGEVVLTSGTHLQEGALGILAMLGRARPKVYANPKVGILATGTELISVSASLQPGKIRDTNSSLLDAKVRIAGGSPVLLGQVKDEINLILSKLYNTPNLPMYIVIGGSSLGDFDLAEEVFRRLKVPILFNRVAIKPGMPILAGIWKGSLLISLSGNPAACSVAFEVLVRPVLRKMAGFKHWQHIRLTAKLSSRFEKSSPVRRFVWARCFAVNGVVYAMPLQFQGNGMLRSILQANALLDIPAECPSLERGIEVETILLNCR